MNLKIDFNLFLKNYTQILDKTLESISSKALNNATDLIERTIKKNYICVWQWRFSCNSRTLCL